jgi:hypothetical protein
MDNDQQVAAGPKSDRIPADYRALAGIHGERLERLFGRRGINSLKRQHPTHPVVGEVEALKKIADGAGIPAFEDVEFLGHVRSWMFEALAWPGEDAWPRQEALSEDMLSFAKDERIRRYILQRLRDPGSYGDVMAELYTWGRLEKNGWTIEPQMVATGLPDLKIRRHEAALIGEVKRIRATSKPSAAARAVETANTQIGRVSIDGAAGVVWIYLVRMEGTIALDDRVPIDVWPYLDAVRRKIGGSSNRRISAAVVTWDVIRLIDYGEGVATYFFGRQSELLRHSHPRVELPYDCLDILPTQWLAIHASRHVSDEPGGVPGAVEQHYASTTATIAFRQLSEHSDGIRAGQALEVLRDPDGTYGIEGSVLLATRYVPSLDFILLVIAKVASDGQQMVNMAFRLHAEHNGRLPDAHDPKAVLWALLERFGLPVRIDGDVRLFHERISIQDPFPIPPIETLDTGGSGTTHAVLRRKEGGFDIIAAFAVDRGKYLSDVRSHSSQAGT